MKFAIVQIRGPIHVNYKLKDTLRMLKLPRKNSCVVIDDTPCNRGMILKLKDYITWGEVSEETMKALLLKRGRLPGGKQFTEEYLKEKINMSADDFVKELISDKKKIKDVPGLKQFFRLKPPIGGFERGGIKRPFSMGGVLGYRKDKINELIMRML